MTALPLALRYKLLTALVVPRPIALVTSVGPDGVVNAAPFSFFNVFSEDPALVVLGLQARPDGTPKERSSMCVKPEHSSSTSSTKRWPIE
jgi:flavin reductase (DIM6/NTAB) family NADH-FMN oxidoreductase RutF